MPNQSNEFGDQAKESEHSHSVLTLTAVTDGEVLPIEEVPDDLFSKKMIGNGFAMRPSSETVYSPINGKLVEVAETKHAYYIESEEGIKILIHIGIDTLFLNGEGFSTSVEKNMSVKQGDKLAVFDKDLIIEKGFDPIISIIVLDHPSILSLEVRPNSEAKAQKTEALNISLLEENK
ncbi:hypothetical protein GCM10008932_21340 [Alkalibacterium iburiense]|uniref:PTS EIIA type-1 domain-containing protein n=1 Tax=Alkalibacterium iburiense TaxID=290589 RepID=A0ABN0XPC7_9LACT